VDRDVPSSHMMQGLVRSSLTGVTVHSGRQFVTSAIRLQGARLHFHAIRPEVNGDEGLKNKHTEWNLLPLYASKAGAGPSDHFDEPQPPRKEASWLVGSLICSRNTFEKSFVSTEPSKS